MNLLLNFIILLLEKMKEKDWKKPSDPPGAITVKGSRALRVSGIP